MHQKISCIYILASKKDGVIYVGVTSNLQKRIYEHKNNIVKGFTERYNVHDLVYYEVCPSMDAAILREKQLKAGSRDRKMKLIEKENPLWLDLYDRVIENG